MNKNSFEILDKLIGNTPMIGIQYRLQDKVGIIYAKCEYYNVTGSIKDRIALQILREAFLNNKLKTGDTIVEATSGNTGISLAAIGRLTGCNVTIIMPDWLSKERFQIIESFGANIITVSREEGGFLRSIALSEEMAAKDPNIFLPKQFSNIENVKAHEKTGNEIYNQLKEKHAQIDAFIAGVGTGGTIIGVGKALREHYPNIKIHPLEPLESPTLSTGYKHGNHRIQGISDEFIPDIMHFDKTDEIVQVSDGDAIIMAQKLAKTLGLGVGISSGANFAGAIKLQQKYGFNSVVATVFPDCNKKYLSTALTKTEPVKDEYLAPKTELLGIV
ncbi:MAG: cysteine synthase family protein [Bacteroidetes bacterium]|nr:cysteine synthase family protein [Bacteroidota bacterium]MCL1968159.1 cysteine synthase family protein [Bacteroidota bacterium]